jgi:hypothetical protein
MRKNTCLLLPLFLASAAHADFDPVLVMPASFNHDIVVESNAPGPVARASRATMDGGTNNTGRTFYEIGYNTASPTTGLPAAGSTFVHQTFADHSYTLAPSYTAPNALLITPPTGFVTNGTFTLTVPAPYSSLSVLADGGNGGVVVNYIVHFADATTETGTISITDWFNVANPAWTASGRFNNNNATFDNVGTTNPRLHSYDIPLANTLGLVTSIDFTYRSGTGRDGIYALSGSVLAGGPWVPILVTGYAYDMIIEASSPMAVPLTTATTASMDGGTNNNGNTWFERGYDPFNPGVGLPVAGSTINSAALPNHHYTMAASYTSPNAIMVDSNGPTANLTLATPTAFTGLSFLTAAGNGNSTVQATLQFGDGTSEILNLVIRDWFNNAPVAFTASGRVNLNNRFMDNINLANPRLYDMEVALANTTSLVSNIALTWISGPGNSHAVILALSGTSGPLPPILGQQPTSTNVFDGTTVTFNVTVPGGTQPITYQWQKGTNGVFVNLADGGNVSGATTTNLTLTSVTLANAGDYRLVASNGGGSVNSSVATLTVLLSLPDVTAPGDPITAFGGTSPAGEEVLHAIDNVTQKYLNFGANGGAPFVGPVGLVVTPAMGPTLVTAMRFYTANDAVERDPADYVLEGSKDGGTTYTLISSNSLSLPTGRNPGGSIALDPLTNFLQQVTFVNASAYSTYRLSFTRVKNSPAAANSMQIAEIELLGTLAAVLTIERGPADDEVTLRANMDGTLQATTELKSNPQDTVWQNVGPIGPSTPVTLPVEPLKFFRLSIP